MGFLNETATIPKATNFSNGYRKFQELIKAKSKYAFTDFDEGLAAAWENYKPKLHAYALLRLDPKTWSEETIGSGKILENVINSIEIQEDEQHTNNLVFWQNRYGHANRDHHVLLDAVGHPRLRMEIELLLFQLYRNSLSEGVLFDELSRATGRKYPLMAYLFFLKDIDRFMPIQPTGFDRAFQELGIDFSTLRKCGWENYTVYNGILETLRPLIAETANISTVRLIDAHSFCWILSSLLKQETNGTLTPNTTQSSAGRVVGGRERSIIEMCFSVKKTVQNSNGQITIRSIKNKDLNMDSRELEGIITTLLERQNNCCALTGIPFHFHGQTSDANLLPSVDRIDSDVLP